MKIKIYRIDKSLELPQYQTHGSVGFDFVCRTNSVINPNSLGLIPGNVIIEVPEGYMLSVLPRSSTPKKGLVLAKSMGVIDNDYCGPEDEIKLLFYNFTDKPVKINKGDRLAQGIFVKILKPELQEINEPPVSKNRNGFGSTG
jgi:dUTP pyrophosphatase